MRIALIIERLETSRGGRETSIAQIASALARRGHDVTVLCQCGRRPHEKVTLRELGQRGMSRAGHARNFVFDVQQELRTGRFDIVHTTLPVPGSNVYQLRGGTIPGQRIAGQRRRSSSGQFVRRMTEPLNLARREMAAFEQQLVVDEKVLCLPGSEMVAEELREHYARDEGVRVVYNAVDVPDVEEGRRGQWRQTAREEIGAGEEETVFLTVATNFRLKGVAEAIEAFARLNLASDTRLVAVGHPSPRRYRRLAARRGVSDRVHFVGPTEEVFRWYSAADVCVLLSWYDPCSRVVLEAIRWEVPSITTAYNGAAEVLGDGAGIVIPSPAEIPAATDAMAVLSDRYRRTNYVEACGRKAEMVGVDRHLAMLLRAYEELARHHD